MSSNPEIEAIAPPIAPAHPVLDHLRAATGGIHKQLDSELALSREPPSRALYLRHAAAMLGWLVPLERRLRRARWPRPLEVRRRLTKSRALVIDLLAGGLDTRDIMALPRCPALPRLDRASRRYGALYVLEGSTLGGQVLARRFAPHVGDLPLAGLRGYGRDTGRMWRIFCATLERIGADPGFSELAGHSARQTFRSLLEWMRFVGVACPSP